MAVVGIRVARICSLALVVLLGGALSGCGGLGLSPAERVAQRSVQAQFVGNPRTAWATLHPSYQRLIGQRRFIRCSLLGRGRGRQMARVAVVDTASVPIARRGIAERHGEEVQLAVTLNASEALGYWVVDLVKVKGRWRWLLEPTVDSEYKKFSVKAKVCPS